MAEDKPEEPVKELLGLDLYEVSLTSAPANGDTRIIDAKSLSRVQIRSFEC